MTTFGLIINPDGRVQSITEPNVAARADDLFSSTGGSTVLSLIGAAVLLGDTLRPHEDGPYVFVGWVAEWGRIDRLPLNVKAWALYGRSPICGPMVVALDGEPGGNRQPLPELFVEALLSDRDWVTPELRANMRGALEQEAAAGGDLWVPDWNGVES